VTIFNVFANKMLKMVREGGAELGVADLLAGSEIDEGKVIGPLNLNYLFLTF